MVLDFMGCSLFVRRSMYGVLEEGKSVLFHEMVVGWLSSRFATIRIGSLFFGERRNAMALSVPVCISFWRTPRINAGWLLSSLLSWAISFIWFCSAPQLRGAALCTSTFEVANHSTPLVMPKAPASDKSAASAVLMRAYGIDLFARRLLSCVSAK